MDDSKRDGELKREVDREIRAHNRLAALDRMNASAALGIGLAALMALLLLFTFFSPDTPTIRGAVTQPGTSGTTPRL
jgi:hypothetical protein